MKRFLVVYIGVLAVYVALWGSGAVPSIVPQAVPPGSKQGSTGTKFQIAAGSSPSAGNCATWDANKNLVDSGIATCGGAGTAVNSFNTRTGAVVPAANDYDFSQINTGTNALALHVGTAGTLDTTGTGVVTSNKIRNYTVGTLPAATSGTSAYVTDGISSTDCTVGGGSTKVLCLADGSGFVAVGGSGSGGLAPFNPTASPPVALVNWTQVNGNSDGTFANATAGLAINTTTGNNWKYVYIAAPASGTAFTITALVLGTAQNNSQQPGWGMVIGDTGSKFLAWAMGYTTGSLPQIRLERWTNATTFASNPYNPTSQGVPTFWLRVVYDGSGATNTLTFSVSPTGGANTYVTRTTEAVGTFLASNPAKLGYGCTSQNSGNPVMCELVYWSVTTP